LYAFTFILDPRAKVKGFTNVLGHLSHFNGKDYSMYLTEVKDELNDLYGIYEAKFGYQMRMQRPP
jgi:hypothetical protein